MRSSRRSAPGGSGRSASRAAGRINHCATGSAARTRERGPGRTSRPSALAEPSEVTRPPVPLVRAFWDVEIEADALAYFEGVCARRGLSREQAVREAITWFTARAALWELRTRAYRAARITRQAEAFDPIGALLAEPLERPR